MDAQTQRLDSEILDFIRQSGRGALPEGAFEKLALKLFAYQFERNPFYRKFCLLQGKSLERLSDWKEIPAIPADAFKELVLTSFPHRRAVKVFRTSGTTRGRKGAHFFETLKLYEAAVNAPFRQFLLPDGVRCLFFLLTVSPEEDPHSSLAHMMGVVNRRFSHPRPGKFYVRKGRVLFEDFFRDLRSAKGKKVMILATAFSLKAVLDFMREKKLRLALAPGSCLMETGGFKGRTREISKGKLYADCERHLGIREDHCVSEYGMTELSSQYYDTALRDKVLGRRPSSIKEGPAWLRTVVIDPRTGKEARKGQVGILRHFDLANRGSVMAIQTEDLGRAVGGGFELLGRAPGADLRGCSLSYEEFLRGVA